MNYVYSNIIVSTVGLRGICGSAQKVKALMSRQVCTQKVFTNDQ